MAATPDPHPEPVPDSSDRTVPSSPPPAPGELPAAAPRAVGDYDILGLVEKGGMGVVYRARERHSGRLVALKMMLDEGEAHERRRFVFEARATGELSHPGIVAIHAWGEHQGAPYYTMDFVPGTPLDRLLKQGPLSPERAVAFLLGIARAVAAAHAQGIVHRDLKPGNVILDPADRPRVLDFGLAKRRRDPDAGIADALPVGLPRPEAATGTGTEHGAVLGTPSYMAPEQARGRHDEVGPPADVHALGAMFFEMLAGRPPFEGVNVLETLTNVVHTEAPAVCRVNPRVPATLGDCVRRCLRKDPADRYPDAGALADDLERRWHARAQQRRYARLTLGTLGALLLLLVVQYAVTGWGQVTVQGLGKGAESWAAAAGPAVQEAAGFLVGVLAGFAFRVVPFAGHVIILVWLAAWVWYVDRPGRVVAILAGCLALTVAGWALAWWLPGEDLFLFLWGATPVVASSTLILRVARQGGPLGEEADDAPKDSYLQKLFRASEEHGPAPAAGGGPRGLADVELGKVLLDTSACKVQRGRQQSLNRPVLVWWDRASDRDAPPPGVAVDHPGVLRLHAVGVAPQGRYLVTEAVAATPLTDLLERQMVAPHDALLLGAALARAVQGFHDQGANHGRLHPDWILVHSDLRPVLCPCGNPSLTPQDRAADLVNLGRLLLTWLPPRRPPLYLADGYRVAQSAAVSEYTSAAELADDLERALRTGRVRWRQRAALIAVVILFALPLFAWSAVTYLGTKAAPEGSLAQSCGQLQRFLIAHGVLFVAPALVVLGYTQARVLVQSFRVRLHGTSKPRALRLGWAALAVQMLPVVLLPVGWAYFQEGASPPAGFAGCLLTALGYWFLGGCLAGLTTLGEGVVATLRSLGLGDPNQAAEN